VVSHTHSAGETRFLDRAPRHQPVWHNRAACRGADPELFFDPGEQPGKTNAAALRRRQEAKAYCGRCPVQQLCLDLYLGEDHGIFGGMDRDERRNYRAIMARRQASNDGGSLGEEIAAAREGGAFWKHLAQEYRVRPDTLKKYMRTYLASRRGMSEAPGRVEHTLSPAEMGMPKWGDSWVIQEGRYFPAAYQGESADVEPWFFMSIDFGRSQTRKWVQPEAVTLMRRVDRRVIQRKGVLTSGPRVEGTVSTGVEPVGAQGADAPVVLGEEHPGHVREAA
jgi:WhiB family redox-sensing transcriptional regulator